MKKIFYILTAALLLTGCTVDDTAIDNNAAKTVTFTATLAPKGGSEATRDITTGTEGGKEVLTTAWKSGEKIAVYYQTGPDTYATAQATVGAPNADGSAPITATLDNAIDGSTVKFVYPASLANDKGDDIDESKLMTQYGLLTNNSYSISKKFDAATGSGTLVTNGTTIGTSSNVSLTNRVCICKFSFNFQENDQTVNTYTTTITLGSRTYTINNNNLLSPIYLAMLPETSSDCTIMAVGYTDDPSFGTPKSRHLAMLSDVTLEAGKFYRNIPLSLTQIPLIVTSRTLSVSDTEVTLQNGDILTGTGGANTQLKITDGATVILNGVNNTDITQNASIPGIECLGDATIILMGTNRVTGRWNGAGIFVPEDKTLTIKGSGTLYASGGDNGAGIGGTRNVSCGNIVIAGGTVTATGKGKCAGIGSGEAYNTNTTCGNITISGGTVTATGGAWAAGIGSGDNDTGTNTCGAITITVGTVEATGGKDGAGIGSGHANRASNTCGNITITGGTVTATGGDDGAGIGSGNGRDDYDSQSKTHHYYVSACTAISITGGTVEATSGDRAAGIGSGSFGSFASISIGSGITCVTATRSNDFNNVPIGKGYKDQGSGAVTFDGVTMYTGKINEWDNGSWTNWPEDGQTYGGIRVAVTNTPFDDATWTLTRK